MVVITDISESTVMESPFPSRLMLDKDECNVCPEILKAVNLFNKLVGSGNEIRVINTRDIRFHRYGPFFGNLIDSKSLPTPIIFFDGHVLKWTKGAPDWFETYWHLRSLGNV